MLRGELARIGEDQPEARIAHMDIMKPVVIINIVVVVVVVAAAAVVTSHQHSNAHKNTL